MKPFPPDCWELLQPLDGVQTMLELGNKRNPDGVWKAACQSLGIAHTSVDWNGLDGALKLDLRKPLNLGRFDMVTNFGTSEHVSEQEPCWRNMHEAVRVGGWLLGLTPYPGDWSWHGEWYPTREFYESFAALNCYEIERLYVNREPPRRNWYFRLRKVTESEFLMPGGIVKNR